MLFQSISRQISIKFYSSPLAGVSSPANPFPLGWCSVTSQLFVNLLFVGVITNKSPLVNILIQKVSPKNRCFDINIIIW